MKYYTQQELRQQLGQDVDPARLSDYHSGTNNQELRQFLEKLQSPDALLFAGWTDNQQGLRELLTKGSTRIVFTDDLKILDHTLSGAYKRFVSPFLYPRILRAANEGQFGAVMSYLPLLDPDTRPVVEDQVYQQIAPLFQEVKGLFDKKVSEQELINASSKAISDDIIATINIFSRASYALKLKYVDAILDIINARSCTLRFANWLLKQLERLQLNAEHQYKINDLRTDLRNGHITVRNTKTRRGTGIPFRTIFYSLLSVGIIGFASWLILYKPWSEPEKPDLADNSSFTSFSKEERRQLDSLLKSIEPDREIEQDPMDLGLYWGEEIDITLRDPFKNSIAEHYYQDLNTAMLHNDALKGDSCIAYTQKERDESRPTRMLPIVQKKGGRQTFVRNESEYDVQIVVFRNLRESDVYYGLVPKNSSLNFQLEVGDVIWAIPGNSLRSFQVPEGYSDELPSNDFNQFFCDIDINHINGMNTAYYVAANPKQSYKFLLVGTASERFELIDLHGVLEQY